MRDQNRLILPDCPNCGEKEGAGMGSSRWCHQYSCCSDKCGEEFGSKLLKLHMSTEFIDLIKLKRELNTKLRKLEAKLVVGDSKALPFRYNWE